MLKKLNLFFGTIAIQFSKLIKISYIIGSHTAFFSATNILSPILGVFLGIRAIAIYSLVRFIADMLFFGVQFGQPVFYILYHISSIFASAYWLYDYKLVRMGLPALAIAIFALHPAGSLAYAMLWFIPIFTAFVAEKNLFYKSLGATFTAHAFGSVVYLFTRPTIPWVSIIPVAIVERLLFAVGMVLVYKAGMALKSYNLPRVFSTYKRA